MIWVHGRHLLSLARTRNSFRHPFENGAVEKSAGIENCAMGDRNSSRQVGCESKAMEIYDVSGRLWLDG